MAKAPHVYFDCCNGFYVTDGTRNYWDGGSTENTCRPGATDYGKHTEITSREQLGKLILSVGAQTGLLHEMILVVGKPCARSEGKIRFWWQHLAEDCTLPSLGGVEFVDKGSVPDDADLTMFLKLDDALDCIMAQLGHSLRYAKECCKGPDYSAILVQLRQAEMDAFWPDAGRVDKKPTQTPPTQAEMIMNLVAAMMGYRPSGSEE